MTACVVALFVQFSSQAHAGVGELQLTCFTNHPSGSLSGEWAAPAVPEETSVGSGTETQFEGFDFENSVTEPQIQCSFFVPADYDSSAGSPPTIAFMGWMQKCINCPGACGTFGCINTVRAAKFIADSRYYDAGYVANAAWDTPASDTRTLGCTASACHGASGWRESVTMSFSMAATPAAGDWSGGGLVFVRIRRDNTVSDNLGQPFTIAAVRLVYPVP